MLTMLLGRALVLIFLYLNGSLTEAKNKTLLMVPRKISSDGNKYIWPWISIGDQWKKDHGPKKPVFTVCDVSPSQEPNLWLRSLEIHVKNATRVDVTLKYAVSKCTMIKHCKDNLQLFVHKTSWKYGNLQNKVPEPNKNIESYQNFGTTKPRSISKDLDKPELNNETYSFFTNRSTPYYYLAIRYQGGCFRLFEVVLSYSFCSSMALSSNLVHLTETIAPANGTIQIGGSCAQNAQPLADNMTLYGNCMANGEWSSHAIGGECLCMAGFGKYLNGTSASCKKCPDGTYQDTASNASCTKCPLNSRVNSHRTMCSCKPGYYRFDNETYMDTCTGPPSEPRFPESTFINATSLQLSWSSPSDLGSRLDVYYEIHCKKCNDEGKDCITNCTGADISHTPGTSRNATVQFLSPYTYYEFKIFAKNGMSSLAEMRDNREPQFIPLPRRTKQSVPGVPKLLSQEISSTEIKLRWKLEDKNGLITYYQVTYHEENKEENALTKNTTKTSIIIKGLQPQKTYIFKIRASTKEGLGKPASKKLTTKKKDGAVPIKKELLIAIVVGVLVLLVFIIVLLIVCIYKRSGSSKSGDMGNTSSWMFSTEMIPLDDGQKMYIDPSTYGSPMEALLSNTEEIDCHDIKLEKNIGGGEFAEVYKGILKKGTDTEVVAVKILKPNASYKSREDFILEASIMGQFKHPNVIELKGVVTRSPDTPMMIVTEFMENGSLNHFLKIHDGKLTVLQLLGMARGVAAGMTYLSGINFIHRDLAARNILVADNMASKVSDFGLSRELNESEDNEDSEYTTQGGKIPIRWTAPEAIRYRKFSSSSDVWSFGILLWEIMSFSDRPYWDWDNFQVMDRVEEGYRLPAPMDCPKSIHNIMLDCWEADKNNRPKFAEIVKRLEELIFSPEKITDDSANARYANTNVSIDLEDETPVQEWLESISMTRYANSFKDAGYVDIAHVKLIKDDDLTRIGVNLIGHRNKISKSIKKMKRKSKVPERDHFADKGEEEAFV